MIEKIRIRGYRKFRDTTIWPVSGMNILVGDNQSGKSTVIEAIGLAMTGRVNGRTAQEELNPYWFNQEDVDEFFKKRSLGEQVSAPKISIELFFADEDRLQRLTGAHNSEIPVRACPGVELCVEPDAEYMSEIEAHIQSGTTILPVEYFRVVWRTFADATLTARPKELTVALIDSRTIRSTSGIDYHLRQMLGDHLDSGERAAISLAYRSVKERMTSDHLGDVNKKMGLLECGLDGKKLGLAMDQSARSSWDTTVSPHVGGIPFGMAGLGQQVAVKIALAMKRNADAVRVVTIEEPENHLSHTSLNTLISMIDSSRGDCQQIFATTHSSYVLNRLGLGSLLLVSDRGVSKFESIEQSTVDYFKKLPGYDTLRIVLAQRIVFVEGPSDEIVFERFYRDKYSKRPIEDGIDVLSMRGLSLKRCLELAHLLDKCCVALRDNDGKDPADLRSPIEEYLVESRREVFIGQAGCGDTLEPQILEANDATDIRKVLGVTDKADLLKWMTNNKTESAIRIAESEMTLAAPGYMADAIEFVHP